jgi:hypothetical protein
MLSFFFYREDKVIFLQGPAILDIPENKQQNSKAGILLGRISLMDVLALKKREF